MKRTPLRRKREMARSTKTLTRATRLRPVGETKRKKRDRYAKYLRSAAWRAKRKACLERADGRCECSERTGVITVEGKRYNVWQRCAKRATTVHHRTYARFGHELPEDLTACCKPHHDELEATLRPWNQKCHQNRRFG